jgi:hypothetical protein
VACRALAAKADAADDRRMPDLTLLNWIRHIEGYIQRQLLQKKNKRVKFARGIVRPLLHVVSEIPTEQLGSLKRQR